MVNIRPARFQDIPAIIALGKVAHSESRFADICDVDEGRAKALLYGVISDDGDSMCALVTDDVQGVIVGSITPYYGVLTIPLLTDHMWYCAPGTNPRTAFALMDALHEWADEKGPCLKRHMVNDAIVDIERSRRLLERKGYRVSGYVFEKEPRS